jgi:hypothetical protein
MHSHCALKLGFSSNTSLFKASTCQLVAVKWLFLVVLITNYSQCQLAQMQWRDWKVWLTPFFMTCNVVSNELHIVPFSPLWITSTGNFTNLWSEYSIVGVHTQHWNTDTWLWWFWGLRMWRAVKGCAIARWLLFSTSLLGGGTLGPCVEHSPFDALPWLRLLLS